MAKTALDLSVEEYHLYRPAGPAFDAEVAARWERAWKVARTAARLLRRDFGASRVVAFGSLTRQEWFTRWSDIDLAAWGIPADRFYHAVAIVTGLSEEFEIDLLDAEDCSPAVQEQIEAEGINV